MVGLDPQSSVLGTLGRHRARTEVHAIRPPMVAPVERDPAQPLQAQEESTPTLCQKNSGEDVKAAEDGNAQTILGTLVFEVNADGHT